VRLLDRYLLREITGPLALGFLVYTFILLLQALFKSAEMIIRRGLPVSTVGELLALSLPNIVVLTIPMSLLFGVLIAIGRMSSDSELVAMRATGVSLLSLYRPILYLSTFFFLINAALMVWVLPWGNHRLQLERLEILTQSISTQVEPRIFWDEWKDQVLYVFDTSERGDSWRGVFLAQSIPSTRTNQVTIAERGRVRVDQDGERVVLELSNAQVHEVDLSKPDSYQISSHRSLEVVLEDQFSTEQRAKIASSKGVRELGIPELLNWMQDPKRSREIRRLARVELHKKFSIPFACIVFGIFALPLGFNTRRGGKASGFALSILVIVVYWVLLDSGEKSAEAGKLAPWLAMWGPNILLSSTGLFLLARRNRDKSLLLTKIDRWIRRDVWARVHFLKRRRQERVAARRALRLQRERERTDPHVVIRLPRVRVWVPNLIDRYVFKVFAGVFALVLLSGLSIYLVADLTGKADEILKNNVPRSVVLAYYKYSSLQMFYEISPILVLVATLITFSLLSKSNEVIAFKALGVSLFRLAVPAVAAALAITIFSAFLESEVLPASNEKVARLDDRIRGRETARTYRRADRQWLFGQDRYIYNYIHYDPDRETLHRLQVFEFDPKTHRLTGRLVAQRATYDHDGWWQFENGWSRSFGDKAVTEYDRFPGEVIGRFPEKPEYFDSEIRPPDQMSYGELKDYIKEVERSGQAVPELKVKLQSKIAYPAISLVMALVALPFAFRLGRQGALYGVGLSIVLGMVFLAIYAFFTTLGQAGALPPAVAVWSPNAVFSMFAVYLFLGVRT